VRFLDSNILLRHLLNDHPDQSPICFALIRDIEQGKEQVSTTDLVIAELVFVLSSKKLYALSRERIRSLLLPLIELPGIKLPNKRLYRRVFDLYIAHNIDYVDAFHAACLEKADPAELYSYDEDFDRVETVRRLTPDQRASNDDPAQEQ
jgi:predicted nucleic acid-binding protein